MKHFKYLGQLYNTECDMCGIVKTKQSMYEKQPHSAVIKLLIDQSAKIICKKCAGREIGSKRKKELNELEKNR